MIKVVIFYWRTDVVLDTWLATAQTSNCFISDRIKETHIFNKWLLYNCMILNVINTGINSKLVFKY